MLEWSANEKSTQKSPNKSFMMRVQAIKDFNGIEIKEQKTNENLFI